MVVLTSADDRLRISVDFFISKFSRSEKGLFIYTIYTRAVSQYAVWHVSSFKKNLLREFCTQFYLLKAPFSYILLIPKRKEEENTFL